MLAIDEDGPCLAVLIRIESNRVEMNRCNTVCDVDGWGNGMIGIPKYSTGLPLTHAFMRLTRVDAVVTVLGAVRPELL
jgi:hypothetical protein